MAPIRLIVQTNPANADEVIAQVVEGSRSVRQEAGCLQAEDFRGTEFAEDLLHIELWESPAAFDAHWQRALEAGRSQPDSLRDLLLLQAPHHHGLPESPRMTGENGIEFYEHRYFGRTENIWALTDETARPASIRWPAWSAVRILIQGTSDPATFDYASQVQNSLETREEPGCIQFEHFRGVEYPENTVLMETWSSPEIYDIHWLNRLIQQRARVASGAPAPAPAPPVQRRYGRAGAEWYHHCYYTLVDNVWVPEEPSRRMVTVRW